MATRRAGHVHHLADRDVALPGIAEAHGDVAAHPHAVLRGPSATTGANMASDSSTVRLRLRREKVSVAAANTAMSRAPAAPGPLQAGQVGDQHRVANVLGLAPSIREKVLGVAELRHPPGRNEAGGLDRPQPGGHQPGR